MKKLSTLFIAFASLFVIQSAEAADALDLVGHWRGVNFTGNQACEVKVELSNGSVLTVTVREGNEELSFPATTVEAVNKAIAAGYQGQFDVKGPEGENEHGHYYWNFRGSFLRDGRVNYLTVVNGQNYGPFIGGQRNLGCWHFEKN